MWAEALSRLRRRTAFLTTSGVYDTRRRVISSLCSWAPSRGVPAAPRRETRRLQPADIEVPYAYERCARASSRSAPRRAQPVFTESPLRRGRHGARWSLRETSSGPPTRPRRSRLLDGMVLLEAPTPTAARATTRGCRRAHADPCRDGRKPARHEGRRAGEREADKEARARARAARGRSHQGQAAPAGRALRPGEGARGHRPLPEARQGRVRPRGPGRGLVPHGHRHSSRCWAPTGTTKELHEIFFDTPETTHAPTALTGLGDDSKNTCAGARLAQR